MEQEFEEVTFESNNDFELGYQNKKRTCKYHIYNSVKNNGLVVYIPGFGSDLGEYSNVFCKKIVERYNLSSMVVEYFCINCRLSVGATLKVEPQDIQEVYQLIQTMGGQPTGDWSQDFELLAKLCEQQNQPATISASLVPQKNEYQNFGIIAALDIVNAIRDAVSKYGLDSNNVMLIGSSYGGYIANLVTKIAPGYMRAVLDNSSWAEPNLRYVVGRELKSPEASTQITPWVTANLYVKSPWTLNPDLPNSFTSHRYEIRSFSSHQLKQMATQGGANTTMYLFMHSVDDPIANTQSKIAMANQMMELGMKVHMTVVDKKDVDGTYVKEISHGMGLSMLTFFDRFYASITEEQAHFKSTAHTIVKYQCHDCCYVFDLRTVPSHAYIEF